jgi:hypothetical protein
VSLAGRLEEIELAELLHFLALNNRTGKVLLTRRDASGLVVVRNGRIVYAGSSSIRESFGNILVCRGLISPAALAEALERQHAAADARKLGDLLVESGALSEAQLEDALKQQTGQVVQELCRWTTGYFRFEVLPVASSGEIGVDAEDLVVAGGVATDQVLLEAMTRMDEAAQPEAEASTPARIAASGTAPSLRAEVTIGLLKRAAPLVARGLLLVLRGDEAQGSGQVGLEATDAEELARRVRLPLSEASLVAEAVDRRRSWSGPFPEGEPNARLLASLGGARPLQAIVVPMLLREGAGLVFYGDDSGAGRTLGPIEDLEWALLEAALAMEKDWLEERLRRFERARGFRP